MSAEAVARSLFATLNRPAGPFFVRLRIGNAALAYVASCFTATTIVATASLATTAWQVAGQAAGPGPWEEFGLRYFITSGLIVWLLITIIGLVVAAPFVIAATLLGGRHRIESAPYYIGLGGLSASAVALLLVGTAWDTDFGLTVWLILAPCGACFGMAWWYLHRRWTSEDGTADRDRLAAVFFDGRAG